MLISVTDQVHSPNSRQALAAREWFKRNGPADAPPLPLGYDEREDLKVGGLKHIIAWYACSLACRDYAVEKHPSFDDYARGVMASDYISYPAARIQEDAELQKRFPPRPLAGLGPALVWEPPAIHAETMASWQRSHARAA